MLKNILKLEGAQKLTKKDQKSINGGIDLYHVYCPISETDCFNISGKWNIYQKMCIVEASQC